MSRPVSQKVQRITADLENRLRCGLYDPGQRFLSNRELANRHAVSYQTAQRILTTLAEKGLIERMQGAGSLVAGESASYREAALCFHPRSRLRDTFGAHLISVLSHSLDKYCIPYTECTASESEQIPRNSFPIVWEQDELLSGLARSHRPCLLINQRPPIGLAARRIDSLGVDDRSGGRQAGELARDLYRSGHPAILAGPAHDARASKRIEGFRTIFPAAHLLNATTWSHVSAQTLKRLSALQPDLVFCGNDRLAVLLKNSSADHPQPVIIGFDDAPSSQQERVTTIGFPWQQLGERVAELLRSRLGGDRSPATHQSLSLTPIIRS